MNTPPPPYHPFKPPFKYLNFGTQIVDSNDQRMLDVRGWGYLTGKGCAALGLSDERAEQLQDAIGELVAKTLNDSIK